MNQSELRKFEKNIRNLDIKLTIGYLGNIIYILRRHSAPALWLFRYRELPNAGAFSFIINSSLPFPNQYYNQINFFSGVLLW